MNAKKLGFVLSPAKYSRCTEIGCTRDGAVKRYAGPMPLYIPGYDYTFWRLDDKMPQSRRINDCHRAKADGRRRRPLFVRNINMLNGNKVTIITPRSAHLPQVVQFHYQGRARFYVRHVFASIAVALHMLGLGEAPSKRGARAEGANR